MVIFGILTIEFHEKVPRESFSTQKKKNFDRRKNVIFDLIDILEPEVSTKNYEM